MEGKKENDLAIAFELKAISERIVNARKLLWNFPDAKEYTDLFLEFKKLEKAIEKIKKNLGVTESDLGFLKSKQITDIQIATLQFIFFRGYE